MNSAFTSSISSNTFFCFTIMRACLLERHQHHAVQRGEMREKKQQTAKREGLRSEYSMMKMMPMNNEIVVGGGFRKLFDLFYSLKAARFSCEHYLNFIIVWRRLNILIMLSCCVRFNSFFYQHNQAILWKSSHAVAS